MQTPEEKKRWRFQRLVIILITILVFLAMLNVQREGRVVSELEARCTHEIARGAEACTYREALTYYARTLWIWRAVMVAGVVVAVLLLSNELKRRRARAIEEEISRRRKRKSSGNDRS